MARVSTARTEPVYCNDARHALETMMFETHVLTALVTRIRSAAEAHGVMAFSQAATPRITC